MKGPVKRYPDYQVITSPYGDRNGKFHNGVDLRSVRWLPGWDYVKQWSLQDVITTENCKVDRFGTDPLGNDFIVLYGERFIFKYIHVTVEPRLKEVGMFVPEFCTIGKTQVKGSSQAHHLHFEVWRKNIHINPIIYFDLMGIKYKNKE